MQMPSSIQTSAKTTDRFEVPWDLRRWVKQSELLEWVCEEVSSLDWENPELIEFLRANPAYQPRFLLVLTAYAYGLGVCESGEVVAFYYANAELKSKFPSQNLTAPAVSRFRREHRGLLKWALVQCFKRALRQHFGLGHAPIPPGLRRVLDDAATNRLDIARHVDRSAHTE